MWSILTFSGVCVFFYSNWRKIVLNCKFCGVNRRFTCYFVALLCTKSWDRWQLELSTRLDCRKIYLFRRVLLIQERVNCFERWMDLIDWGLVKTFVWILSFDCIFCKSYGVCFWKLVSITHLRFFKNCVKRSLFLAHLHRKMFQEMQDFEILKSNIDSKL